MLVVTRLKLNLEVGTPKDKSAWSGEPNKECFFLGLWRLREAGPSIRQGASTPTVNAFFMPRKGQKMTNSILLQSAVSVSNGKVTTTSLKVAEIFGKRHDHVLRDIENLEISQEWRLRNFTQSQIERKTPTGGIVKSKAFAITKDGFTLLAMGFTGKKAMQFKIAYIEAFNAMEAKLRELQAAPVQPELPLLDSQTDMEKLELFYTVA